MNRTAHIHSLSTRIEATLFKSRNAMGEFEANDGETVDPGTMARAYGAPSQARRSGMGIGGKAGLAVAAGGTATAALLARRRPMKIGATIRKTGPKLLMGGAV